MEIDEEQFWITLRAELLTVAQTISRLKSQLDANNRYQEYFLYRLMMACENATGCVLLGNAKLAAPLSAVARALFESLIVTYWASLKDENANEAMGAATREATRMMRNAITEGRAKIVHKTTGAEANAAVLNHPMMKEARRPKRLDQMAKEAGMKNVYDTHYGFLSLFAHGTATEIHVKSTLSGRAPIYEQMSLVRACLKAIALVCANRIEGVQTARSDLEGILKVTLSA